MADRPTTGVTRVALGVRDLDAAVDFYVSTWGLEPVARQPDVVHLAAASSAEPYVLRLRRDSVDRLDVVTLGAPSRAAVAEVLRRAEGAGREVVSEPAPLDGPGGGYGGRFLDPDGRTVEILADPAPRPARRLEPTESVPAALSHVVVNSPDPDGLSRFYCDLLGLLVSDYLEDKMIFLRAGEAHHTLAVARGPHVSLNHVAYETIGVEEFMRSTGRVMRLGHELLWGPGRHGPGDNTFAYFHDPNGFIAEFTTGLERIVDDRAWTPRVFRSVPEESDLWGTANPRPGAAFVGVPDPGAGVPPPC